MRKYIVTPIVLVLLLLVACSDGENNNEPTDPNDNQQINNNEIENDVNNEGNNEENNNEIEDGTNENNNDQAEEEDKITETGIYNGQADPHTIEIETDDGPLAFQLTMEARDDIDALTEGNEVIYTYEEDGDQRTIDSIQPR